MCTLTGRGRPTIQPVSSKFCASLFFTYDISDRITAVFVFYGYWGRARCKIFASVTYHRQVMTVFAMPIWSETAPVLAILLCQVIFCC